MARKAVAMLLLALVAGTQAEWSVVASNIMTVAFGVSATEQKTVYLTGGDDGAGAAILKSTDGGVTLTHLEHDLQMMYMAIDMNGKSGVAGTLGFWGYTAPGSRTDDGETFTAFGSEILFSAAQSVVAVDNSTQFLVGGFQTSWNASSYAAGIMVTRDTGATYETIDWNIDNTPRYGAASSNAWIITGGYWPTSEAESATPNYHAFSQHFGVSYSDGKSDKSLALKVKYRDEVIAQNADQYHAVIAVSTDEGRTWNLVFEDVGRFYMNGVHCIDNNCWAVGEGANDGYILQSTDGGLSWTINSVHAGASLLDIEFSSRTEGWAVGGTFTSNTFNALFLHTTDGGVTWVADESVPNAYPNGISLATGGYAYSTAFMRNGLSSLLAYTP